MRLPLSHLTAVSILRTQLCNPFVWSIPPFQSTHMSVGLFPQQPRELSSTNEAERNPGVSGTAKQKHTQDYTQSPEPRVRSPFMVLLDFLLKHVKELIGLQTRKTIQQT